MGVILPLPREGEEEEEEERRRACNASAALLDTSISCLACSSCFCRASSL